MASMAPQTTMLPLQQIAVPPAPAPTPQFTASSDGMFKINWFKFRDHVRRAQQDNQSGDMLTDVTICCRNQGDANWAYFNASKGVLLSGCAELREEILARPDNRPIYITWKMPVRVMVQLLRYLHFGTFMGSLQEMKKFMLAKHQLRVGAVYGNDYSYQLIRILNPHSVDPMVTVGLHSPWVSEEYLPGVTFDDMKENTNCAAECIAGQCIHKKRMGNPSIRIGLKKCLQITRTPVQGNEQEVLAPQVSLSTDVAGDRARVVALDHDYCGSIVSGAVNTEYRCDFCGRKFISNAELRQHHTNTHFLRV